MRRSNPILWSIAAGTVGAVINLFPVPLFSGVLLHLGGALYLSAGILLGPVYGLVAAILTLTLSTWSPLWAVAVFGLEGLVVPWAVRRHSIRPVFADFVGRGCALIPWSITVARLGLATFNPDVWVSVLLTILHHSGSA
jgi:hypothetical protein